MTKIIPLTFIVIKKPNAASREVFEAAAQSVGKQNIEISVWDDPNQFRDNKGSFSNIDLIIASKADLEEIRNFSEIIDSQTPPLFVGIYSGERPKVSASSELHSQISEEISLSSLLDQLQLFKDSLLLKRKLAELEKYEQKNFKMASLGEMTATLAHEINNPLTIILGQVSLLKRQFSDEENNKLGEGLSKIELTVKRISSIIKSLKLYSRNDELDPPEVVDIKEVTEDTLVLCYDALRQNEIVLYKDNLVSYLIKCREVQISQIILNLIQNSIDAVKDSSEKWIEVSTKADEECLIVQISDSGKLAAGADKDKIFQSFFTTKEKGKGTGLGLSCSRKIAEESGGSLKMIEDQKNTTFELKLPFLP